MHSRRVQAAALGLAVLLAGVVGFGLLTRPPAAPAAVDIANLEQAVAVGLLDDEVLAGLRADGEARAIVHLDVAGILDSLGGLVGEDRAAALIEAMAAAFKANKATLLAALGPDVILLEDFERLGAVVVTLRSEEVLLAALRSDLVSAVTADRLLELHRDMGAAAGAARVANLAPSIYEGAGVAVGVLDTGVDAARYPECFPAGSVAGTLEAAPEDFAADDDGHGSHVASTVLLMAPQASLYVADVFRLVEVEVDGRTERQQRASSAVTLRGMDWVIGLKQAGVNVRAVNLSLGHGHFPPSICVDQHHFREAYAAGIIPVVSAGNSAYRDDEGRPTTEFQPGLGGNACNDEVLSVGAATSGTCADGLVDTVATFSQSAPALDLLAPGTCIVAAGGSLNGTSMAAPHVSGAVAVLANAKPEATAYEVWSALVSVGPFIPDARSGVARRRLDIPAAVDALLGAAAPRPTPVPVEARGVAVGVSMLTPTGALRPGERYAFELIAIRNMGTVAATYGVTVEAPSGFLAAAPAAWFSVAPDSLELAAGALGEIQVAVRPSRDAKAGAYAARLRIADASGDPAAAQVVDVSFVVFDGDGGSGGTPGQGDDDELGGWLENPIVIIIGILVVLWLVGRATAGARRKDPGQGSSAGPGSP